jgi:soluble lytic murein transglycosylase-like protein
MRLSCYAALLLAALTTPVCAVLAKTESTEVPTLLASAEVPSAAPEQPQQATAEVEQQVNATKPASPAAPRMPKHEVVALVDLYAREHGVPIEFARAVVHVESSYNPHATGSVGEIGLMQLKFATARMIGFTGTREELYEPVTNLNWGMKYLAGAWKLGGNSTCGAVIRYQGGHARKTHTSVSKRYCSKVQKYMASN